ncbi:MAG: NAD(P)H-hydrate dehydratase [Cryobacterium sp.]
MPFPSDEQDASGGGILTPAALRGWPLPQGAESKYGRGDVVIVGGARRSPGAVLLAGTAALRAGAGRLTLAVAESVAVGLGVAVPESGVVALAETPSGAVRGTALGALADDLRGADAVLLGSGLDDADETLGLLVDLPARLGERTSVLLDAFALGVLPRLDGSFQIGGALVLTPNAGEAARLLGRELNDIGDDLSRIADTYGATVTCRGVIAAPGSARWLVGTGQGGLGTSGSGDVLAGTITGLLARGATGEQAACWGTYLHAAAGDRLNARIGPTGYLARELVDELPALLAELGQQV